MNSDILNRGIAPALGKIESIWVINRKNPNQILARRTIKGSEGAVKLSSRQFSSQLLLEANAMGNPTKILDFTTSDDVVVFEPIRINLQRGWTVSCDLVWNGFDTDISIPICLYELATFEDNDRIVCGIQPDGLPFISLRIDGLEYPASIPYSREVEIKSGKRLTKGNRHLLTWELTSFGLIRTFIDGESVFERQLLLPNEPDPGFISPGPNKIESTGDGPTFVDGKEIKRPNKIQRLPVEAKVFESHRLGAPNTAQTHAEVKDALFDDTDDAQTIFTGFTGKIIRFGAWNTCVPKAAEGWDHTPGPDRTWARSLVTVESKHRYLHAGRLDGLEPSVTLFPLDMDGGLAIETSLDQAHAALTHAHNQQAAAEAHAAHLKEAALQDAHAKADAASKNLADTQAKAAADTAAAQAKANKDKAAERQRKADADAKAERDRVTGADQANTTREKGKQQAESQESSATEDKKNKIGGANSRLSQKRSDRDAKQQEYDKKR
ncbi:MAG: cell envelope integrity protein TolA [Saprospirales bacterium]|nr:cell envelope integrity protein TolA [Saprospirales bacterium]